MLKGNLEVQISQHEKVTLHNALRAPRSHHPALDKVPGKKTAMLTTANESLLLPSDEVAPSGKPLKQMISSCTLKCLVILLVVYQNKMVRP